eukprot:9962692-Karenia_brevis.AAC.1
MEWRRKVMVGGKYDEAFCCPEDVLPSKACEHDNTIICSKCSIPICKTCWHFAISQQNVPKALCCDNFIGYAHKFLVDRK